MYVLILILLLIAAFYVLTRGVRKRKTLTIVTGLTLGVVTLLSFWFMGFWGEKLWFDTMGYSARFWTVWSTKIGLFTVAAVVGGTILYFLTPGIKDDNWHLRKFAVATAAVLSGLWWYGQWDVFLRFINRVSTSATEPILNLDPAFYLFTYPFLQNIYAYLFLLTVFSLAVSIFHYLYSTKRHSGHAEHEAFDTPAAVYRSAGAFLLVLGYGKFLDRYALLFSEFGIVSGPGWTDVHIRLPLLPVVAAITIIAAAMLWVPRARTWVGNMWKRKTTYPAMLPLYAIGGLLAGIWLVLLGAAPALVQWLKVEPNEITVEKPYIENNIRYTRSGFHLDKIEEREYPVSEKLDRSTLEHNKDLFNNIRLWDYRALDAVYKQFQEIRLYYEFNDVDIDRYSIDGSYSEVMISAREMQPGNLPEESQTFVNKRFKYTHGYGAVLNRVNEFTPDGLPNLLIKDIPPVSTYPNLKINQPEVYYGEIASEYVVVNSEEKEFDYPSGEKNIYANYSGSGGVQITNFWKKLLYGWKFGGTRFLLTGYTTEESRIMLHRQIADRAKTLAPFLYFDDDPYIVISEGKLYWMMDAYTTSQYYPYSEPFSSFENLSYVRNSDRETFYNLVGTHLKGKNYIRNSVKIVIDAFNGDTDLYIFEKEDPIIQVYDKLFPNLMKDGDEMPSHLRKHIRYPADMLLVQGLVYGKYHMTDPTVFYNQEDLWIRATEKYYNRVQPVEPYYIMWRPPASEEMEFVLILPFSPKNKQVMIGWIAGMCDGEDYGRFLAYKFPKEKRVLGTQQVETKIDQDSFLSGQLTLWDQRGSNVIRGNVLALPISETILYVEPIYLQSETSAYPELRLVAVMHNDQLSYAETFDQALSNLLTETSAQAGPPAFGATESMDQLIKKANEAFENYLNAMHRKAFAESGEALQNLRETLQRLAEEGTTKTNKE